MATPEKTVLVTGAASPIGFGYKTVERFSRNIEYKIYATDKQESIHAAFPTENYPAVETLELDVRNPK